MNLLDLLLACIVGGSVIAGFLSGFTKTALGMIATVAGVILGFWFYETPASWFVGMTGSQTVANLFGFFTVFFIVLAVGAIVARLISGFFKLVGLSFIDRLAGAAFGLARGALAAAAATAILVAATPRPVPGWMKGSTLLPYALGASDLASSLAPKVLKDALSESIGEVKKAWSDEVDKAKKKATGAFTPEPAPKEVEIVPPPKAKSKTPKAPPRKTRDQ
jgi:membrane protein required for colicin V production